MIENENLFGYHITKKLWLFCSNMDLSDHSQIFHTGVLKGEEFNEKGFSCRKLTVLEIIAFKINELP
jgi:hypothetical protein